MKPTQEIINNAKQLYSISWISSELKTALENDFPELKKCEDERIRTRLIALVEAFGQGKYKNEMLAYLEKQKEQQPSWTKIDKSRESVFFPFNARVKDSDKVVIIIDGQLNSDGKLWIRFTSNKDDGFKVYNPEDLLVEQKPAKWSDEEKGILLECISALQNSGNWLLADKLRKSLRPQFHWKLSEDEITAIEVALKFLLAHTSDEQLRKNAISVIEHLKQL